MAQLVVYKASAGSGKTFRLAVEYLKLLLNEPKAYRNILAVTFTNKATAEMKSRIMDELFAIASGRSNAYLKVLASETGLSEAEIKLKAKKALTNILHDYSRFRIETIDSFFQMVLRNMARELNLGAYFSVELDSTMVLDEAVELLIEKADENPLLLKWITDYINEKIAKGKRWDVRRDLKNFGVNIYKEQFKLKEQLLFEKLNNKEQLDAYRKQLRDKEQALFLSIKEKADHFFALIERNGLSISDFSYGLSGVAGYFNKVRNGEVIAVHSLGSRIITALESADSWSAKNATNRKQIVSLAETEFMPLLIELVELCTDSEEDIISCQMILKSLSQTGLLYDIAHQVRQLNSLNNRFVLSDTSALLRAVIGDGDTSFVFEKIGATIKHVMIDEFQDTSRMQWDNFKLLLLEGLSQGNNSLLVGDVKQSIYRWRNGDWRILNRISDEFTASVVTERTLDINWRSERKIIAFNNRLFLSAASVLSDLYQQKFGIDCDDILKAYADVAQTDSKQVASGFVEVQFVKGDEQISYNDCVMERLIDKIEWLQLHGVHASDIAILVRKNDHVKLIAQALQTYTLNQAKPGVNYKLISNEAFRLDSSPAVMLIIHALNALAYPDNDIFKARLCMLYQLNVCGFTGPIHEIMATRPQQFNSFLPDQFNTRFNELTLMPLYELVEELAIIFNVAAIDGQNDYLFAFFDKLNDFLKSNSFALVDFLEFWEEDLCAKTILSGDVSDGIRIMSIHKSKGLQFHSVLVPFCDWNLENETNNNVIWCSPENEPYNHLDLVAVKYTKNMAHSIFKADYLSEGLQLYVDNLNVMYVAFTRAEKNLLILGEASSATKNKEQQTTTVSDLMLQLFQNSTGEFAPNWNPETQTYSQGELVVSNKGQQIIADTNSEIAFISEKQRAPIIASNVSLAFIENDQEEQDENRFISRGKMLHQVFAAIATVADINRAIDELIVNGVVSQSQKPELHHYISNALSDPRVAQWYSGKYTLFNECAILHREVKSDDRPTALSMKRPDRVMINADEVVVVDFKFGQPRLHYEDQVKQYVQLLGQMGYQNVKGYVWYVDLSNIQEVGA